MKIINYLAAPILASLFLGACGSRAQRDTSPGTAWEQGPLARTANGSILPALATAAQQSPSRVVQYRTGG